MIKKVTNSLGSVRAALVVAVTIPFLAGASVYAQAPAQSPASGPPPTVNNVVAGSEGAAAGAQTAERIIVTGSNIPTAEEVTASPLDTVTSADIDASGATTADVLTILQKRNPDFTGGANLGSTNANIAATATEGGSGIQIRGFPTLVLFEGRRIVDAAALAQGGFQFADVSLFPTSLISRIEVLKDGASALYGSEAVGGVVNIFLKKDFEGLEVGARYGFTVESGVAERKGYAIAGVGNDTTHVTFGFQYYEIDPLFNRERAYSQPFFGTTTFPGSGRDDLGGHSTFYILKPGLNSPFDAPGVTPGSIPPPPATGPNPGQYAQLPQAYTNVGPPGIQFYNLSKLPTTTLDISNTNAYGDIDHQIFGKQLEFFGNFLFAKNHNLSFLNGQPLNNATGVVIPPGRVGTNNDVNSPGYVPGMTNTIYNPFQLQIDNTTLSGTDRLFANQRFQDHPRESEDDVTFYRFLGGLRSQITPNWNVETAAYYSNYGLTFTNTGLVNATQLNALIAGTATDANGAPIPALDYFARNVVGTGPGQLTPGQFNTTFGADIRNSSSYQEVFDAKVYGFPVHLPGGDLGVSFGGEFREEGFKLQDSPEIFVGSVPVQDINVGRYIESAYAEVSVPIVGPEMKIPGIYSLDVDAAYRHDTYEHLSTAADVPKYTLRYQPIQDLTLRATYSNSFVAPNLYQLDGPVATGFSNPIVALGGDQAQVESGSNPNLVPSTAESYTAGIVYSPHFVPGLTLSAEYFRTLQQQIVSTLGGDLILPSVDALGTASPYANLVAFNNFPGQPGAKPVTGPGQLNGNLASVFYLDTNINIGAVHVGGFDFNADYNLDLRQWGQAEIGMSAVWFTLAEQKTTPTSDYFNIANVDFSEGGGALPDYRLNGIARYSIAGASLAFNAIYIPGLLNGQGQSVTVGTNEGAFQRVGDYLQIDGRLAYEFKARPVAPPAAAGYSKDAKDSKGMVAGVGATAAPGTSSPFSRLIDGLTVAVGCNNIFDRQPPLITNANNNTDSALYDPYGRFVYFEVSKKF